MTSHPFRSCRPWAALCVSLSLLLGGATCASQGPVVQPSKEELRPVLGASDVVEVRIYGEPDLSGVHRVTAEGTIRLPLVGNLEVDGLTADEAAERVQAAYNTKYLKEAQATVLVQQFNSRKIYVLGEVGKPGAYPYEDKMTLIGAIAIAGGTSRLADLNRTLITREADEATVRQTVAVADIRKGQAPDVELQPGDIIFVPESLF